MNNKLLKRLKELDRIDSYMNIGILEFKTLISRQSFIRNESRITRAYPQLTLHDHKHSEAVIEHAGSICHFADLLNDSNPKGLNAYELFYLISACWLHDIGLSVTPSEQDIREQQQRALPSVWDLIREKHHLKSETYIHQHKNELYIEDDEARILGILCRGHRNSENIDESPYRNEIGRKGLSIRIPLLCSILRLADEVDMDYSRAPKSIRQMWDRSGWINEISKTHWLKHYYTQGIQFEVLSNDSRKIRVKINIRIPDELHKDKVTELINKHLITEIQTVNVITGNVGFIFDEPVISYEIADDIEKHFITLGDIRVLIVDDDEDYLLMQKDRLSIEFGKVITSRTAGEAWNIVRAQPNSIHVALIDIEMPDLDGNLSREGGMFLFPMLQNFSPTTALIANSGDMNEDIAERCIKAGALTTHNKGEERENEIIKNVLMNSYVIYS